MFFSELYSTYYNTVAAILTRALETPLSPDDIWKIVGEEAFGESILNIPDNFKNENWQLLRRDGTPVIQNRPQMPLTLLQKRWFKAILCDDRIGLFIDGESDTKDGLFDTFALRDVEPLFLREDFFVFDKYGDGDNFTDANYIRTFRLIVSAIKNEFCLKVKLKNRKGEILERVLSPCRIEYSEKDDKFRVLCQTKAENFFINISRVLECEKAADYYKYYPFCPNEDAKESVSFLLYDTRNALERAMLHFAHFKKQAESLGENCYNITLFYDKSDETEIVIRVLSFGPMIKVTAPERFVELIKERLRKQKAFDTLSESSLPLPDNNGVFENS